MKEYIEERAVEIAHYIIDHNATVRQTAKEFGVSKSTIHKDVTERLKQINPQLAGEARKVLDLNKSERHIRGGMATREKYKGKHMAKNAGFWLQSQEHWLFYFLHFSFRYRGACFSALGNDVPTPVLE